MPHRDDIEAAQQRADALERELRDAKEQLEGLKGNAPPPPPRKSVGVFVALGAVVMVGGGAMTFLAWQAREQHAREVRFEADRAAREALEDARLAEGARADREAAMARLRAREAEAAQRAQALSQTPASTHEVTWRGTLDSTSLPGLRTGEPCVLTGEFSGAEAATRLHGLTLRCGAVEVLREIYAPARSATGLRSGAVYGSDARVFLFSFDAAEADGRSVTLSTMRHSLVITGRTGDGASTAVFLRDVSEPRRGEWVGRGVHSRAPAYEGFREESAQVSRVTGQASVRAGARCVVQVRPVWEFPESCRIAVRCGGTWLYGAGEAGYLTCAVRDGQAVSALDENPTSNGGDPRLRWEGRRVVVSDFTEAGAWEVTLGW